MAGYDEVENLSCQLRVGHVLPPLPIAGLNHDAESVCGISVLAPPSSDNSEDKLSQRRQALGKREVTRRLLSKELEVWRNRVVVVTENRHEGDFEHHQTDVACDVNRFTPFRRRPPLLKELGVNACHHRSHAANGALRERRLDHPPLARPVLAVARNEVIPERQGNALHDQSFSWIVQPIPTKDVLTIFRSADDIDDASIDSRAKDVPVTLKVPFHPMEKIFRRAKMLGRPKWNQAALRLPLHNHRASVLFPRATELLKIVKGQFCHAVDLRATRENRRRASEQYAEVFDDSFGAGHA